MAGLVRKCWASLSQSTLRRKPARPSAWEARYCKTSAILSSPSQTARYSRLVLSAASWTAMRLMQRTLLVKRGPAGRRTEPLWATCTARLEGPSALVAMPLAYKRRNVPSALLWRVARPCHSPCPISLAHCIFRNTPSPRPTGVSHGSPSCACFAAHPKSSFHAPYTGFVYRRLPEPRVRFQGIGFPSHNTSVIVRQPSKIR